MTKADVIKEPTAKRATKTLSDLAEALGVHHSTVRKAVARDEIKIVRYGWEIRVHDEEFDRVLLEGFAPPPRREPVATS